jgi:rhodanese-related sulfurtransferase
MFFDIDIWDLKDLIGKVKIIDIRSVEKYNDNHIPTAINIPKDILLIDYKKYLNFNDTYYIYCKEGVASPSVCSILRKYGYKAVNINGGYQEWILES